MNIYKAKIIEDIEIFYGALLYRIDLYPRLQDHLFALSQRMFEGLQAELPEIYQEFNNYHKAHLGKPKKELQKIDWTLSDCQMAIANEHGFENWEAVKSLGNLEYDYAFERAINHLLAGEIEDLKTLLIAEPRLLKCQSRYGHQATLLHYTGSNGVEFWRQKVPSNLPEITKLLIRLGADKSAKMKVYGARFDTLELVSTSIHPLKAGIMESMRKILSD